MPALGIGRKDFCPGRGDENASMVPQLLDGIFQIQRNRQREVFQKADSIDDSAVIGKWFLTFLSSGSKCRGAAIPPVLLHKTLQTLYILMTKMNSFRLSLC
jgi:hypothetical protein